MMDIIDDERPELFIIGAQKARTTYLAKNLATHKGIFFAEPIELMTFQQTNSSDAGFEEYKNTHFNAVDGQQWLAEGSTTYL